MLWTAFILGLGGSFHCVGMCGPLMMALPLSNTDKMKFLLQMFSYHLGRVLAYGLIGFAFGILGWGIALAGYQNLLSLITGLLLIAFALFSISIKKQLFYNKTYEKIIDYVKSKLTHQLVHFSSASYFTIGFLNGFLPCGLVYMALIGAISSMTALDGAFYMMVFGIGTWPLLFAVMIFGTFLKKYTYSFKKLIPLLALGLGILLVYRSTILAIPVDIQFWESTNFPVMCH